MQLPKKTILASVIGSILEWYDFTVYAYLATIISPKFFPARNQLISLMLAFFVFAIGFLVRPIGAIFFGGIGDRYGRKKALIINIKLMTISTFLISLLPTYEKVGILAPLLLIILRLTQGFAVGGELAGATILVFESNNKNQGFFTSLVWASSGVGILLGTFVVSLLTNLVSESIMNQYVWRIPFALSIVTGIVGFYIRNTVIESKAFNQKRSSLKIPFWEIIKKL